MVARRPAWTDSARGCGSLQRGIDGPINTRPGLEWPY